MSDVLNKVVDIVCGQLSVDKADVNPESSFVEDLGADSLDTVELVMAFEEEFDVEIPDDEAYHLSSLSSRSHLFLSQHLFHLKINAS